MSEQKDNLEPTKSGDIFSGSGVSRRDFLKYAGVSAAAATTLGLVGCDDEDMVGPGNAPSISSISPTSGPAGTEVTIKGQNFSSTASDNTVRFGGTEANVTSPSSTQLVVSVPDGLTMGDSVDVTVTVNGNTATANTQFMIAESMMTTVNLGSGDVGILNYAFALEQLEAAFYAEVVANPYSGISSEESDILQDIADHEETHRAFFEAALNNAAPSKIIPGLTPNFGKVDFSSRASVLGTAKTFEDLGVSAYNGQGQYIETTDYLLLAGKIVSVEARHASAIRDLLNPKSADFAGDDIVDANTGLGALNTSADVLAAASTYIEEDINFSGLPDQQ